MKKVFIIEVEAEDSQDVLSAPAVQEAIYRMEGDYIPDYRPDIIAVQAEDATLAPLTARELTLLSEKQKDNLAVDLSELTLSELAGEPTPELRRIFEFKPEVEAHFRQLSQLEDFFADLYTKVIKEDRERGRA